MRVVVALLQNTRDITTVGGGDQMGYIIDAGEKKLMFERR
jgi:hypothetical protein